MVFGRNDDLVAKKLGDLIIPGLVETAVITGGIGKDSGNIVDLGYRSESQWLQDQLTNDAIKRTYALPTVLLEQNATNGGENVRNSLPLLSSLGRKPSDPITAVAHATSMRRLAETLRHEGKSKDLTFPIYTAPTDYTFDPTNPVDKHEAAAEFKRLIEWPDKGWLQPQELPENLVDFIQGSSKTNNN